MPNTILGHLMEEGYVFNKLNELLAQPQFSFIRYLINTFLLLNRLRLLSMLRLQNLKHFLLKSNLALHLLYMKYEVCILIMVLDIIRLIDCNGLTIVQSFIKLLNQTNHLSFINDLTNLLRHNQPLINYFLLQNCLKSNYQDSLF